MYLPPALLTPHLAPLHILFTILPLNPGLTTPDHITRAPLLSDSLCLSHGGAPGGDQRAVDQSVGEGRGPSI